MLYHCFYWSFLFILQKGTQYKQTHLNHHTCYLSVLFSDMEECSNDFQSPGRGGGIKEFCLQDPEHFSSPVEFAVKCDREAGSDSSPTWTQ